MLAMLATAILPNSHLPRGLLPGSCLLLLTSTKLICQFKGRCDPLQDHLNPTRRQPHYRLRHSLRHCLQHSLQHPPLANRVVVAANVWPKMVALCSSNIKARKSLGLSPISRETALAPPLWLSSTTSMGSVSSTNRSQCHRSRSSTLVHSPSAKSPSQKGKRRSPRCCPQNQEVHLARRRSTPSRQYPSQEESEEAQVQ